MSTISTVTGSTTTSTVISSISDENTATNTDSDSTESTTSDAYTLDITPSLIRASIQNTYDTQLINSINTDTTISNAALYDFYSNLSSDALHYVITSTYSFTASTASDDSVDISA